MDKNKSNLNDINFLFLCFKTFNYLSKITNDRYLTKKYMDDMIVKKIKKVILRKMNEVRVRQMLCKWIKRLFSLEYYIKVVDLK